VENEYPFNHGVENEYHFNLGVEKGFHFNHGVGKEFRSQLGEVNDLLETTKNAVHLILGAENVPLKRINVVILILGVVKGVDFHHGVVNVFQLILYSITGVENVAQRWKLKNQGIKELFLVNVLLIQQEIKLIDF
jgi:hypothetical protein